MRKLLTILLLSLNFLAESQSVQTAINVPYTSSASPTSPALLYKPDDYATATSTYYPLLIFLHGSGEAGSNLSQIYNNSTAGGPAYFIEHSGWPSSFTNPMDGQPYKFIVLSPQRPSSWSWQAPHLNYFINYMVNNYRVDPSKIYITGISAGGEGVVGYMYHKDLETGTGFTPIYKPAASVPMAPAISAPSTTEANTAVADSIRMWGLGGNADIYGDQVQDLAGKMNTTKPGIARITRYSGGHCCWGTYYNPTYTESIKKADSSSTVSMNIYEWMLQFSRSDIGGTPTSNAGADQTINLPTSSVTLTGSGTAGSGHTISSYGWTKQSGGSATITSPSSSTTTVTGLSAGTYVFRLTVTNEVPASATDDITITVNASTVNQPPTVTVSADQSITTSTATLSSTDNDPDGTIALRQWTRFPVSDPHYKVFCIGSSTTYGSGTTVLDSSFVGRLRKWAVDTMNIADSVINLGNGGTDPGAGSPTGTTPISGFGSPDPIRNITQAVSRGADVVIVNFPSNSFDNASISASQVGQQLQVIYDYAVANGVECYITTTQPRKDFSYSVEQKLKVIRDTILNRFGSHAIDFYTGINIPGTTDAYPEYANADSIHLTDAGHRRLFELVKAKNIFQNLVTDGSIINTPNTANTTVSSLTVATHKFQIAAYDNNGLADSKITTVTVTAITPTANAGADQTITLPTSSVTLDGSGSTGSIGTYSWTRVSGPNTPTITTPSSYTTTVTGLVQGTYVFELSVNSGESTDQMTVIVNPEVPGTCSGNVTVINPYPTDSTFYTVGGFNPGDTILLNDGGGAFSNAIFVDIHGTPDCPIVIMNDPALGRAVRFRGRSAQIACGNCTYVKIMGNAIDTVQYGIDIEAVTGNWTMSNWATTYNSVVISGRSSNVEVSNVSARSGGEGFEVKQDGVCDTTYNFPNYIMDSIILHDNRVRNTWLEGMYIGNTSPDNNMSDPRPVECDGDTIYPRPIRMGYLEVYNMDIDSTGRGGIQLSAGSGKLFKVYNNTVKHSGMNGDEAQGAGISLGTYTWAHIYNNTVTNTYTYPIASEGGGYTDHPIKIYDNYLDSAGYLHTYNPDLTINTTTLQWPLGIYLATKAVDSLPAMDSTQFHITNNKIGLEKNIDGYSISLQDFYSRMQKSGNIICGNTNLDGSVPKTSVYNNNNSPAIPYTTDCGVIWRGYKMNGRRFKMKN